MFPRTLGSSGSDGHALPLAYFVVRTERNRRRVLPDSRTEHGGQGDLLSKARLCARVLGACTTKGDDPKGDKRRVPLMEMPADCKSSEYS